MLLLGVGLRLCCSVLFFRVRVLGVLAWFFFRSPLFLFFFVVFLLGCFLYLNVLID